MVLKAFRLRCKDVEAELPTKIESCYFSKFHFEKPVCFRGFRFLWTTGFEGSRFASKAEFTDSKFCAVSSFKDALFEDFVDFGSSIFYKSAHFSKSVFEYGARFTLSRFSDFAWFSKCRFNSGSLYIKKCIFQGELDLSQVVVVGDINLEGSEFQKSLQINHGQINKNVALDGAVLEQDLTLENCVVSAKASFSKMSVLGNASFLNTEFGGSTSFFEATFQGRPPNFAGSILHEDTDWRSVSWPSSPATADEASHYVRAYERLKLEMDRLKRGEDELFFLSLELRCKAKRDGGERAALIWIYWVLSNFGQSFWRPITALIMVWVVGLASLFSCALTLPQAMAISSSNLVAFFGFSRAYISAELLQALPWWTKLLFAGQTVVSAVLLFLLLLALRNRFRIK